MAKKMIVEVTILNEDLPLRVTSTPEEFLKAVAEHKDGNISYVSDSIHFEEKVENIKSLEVKFI